MDKSFVNKKSEFLMKHLECLVEYKELSLEDLKDKPKDLKYVEKLIQEAVDCAVDINQYFLEKLDTVSFRNEIVHSYDVNIYLLWSKRSVKMVVEVYKKYLETVIKLNELSN